MKLLLNNKELANFLTAKLDVRVNCDINAVSMPMTADTILWMSKLIKKRGKDRLGDPLKKKFKEKIQKSVLKDFREFFNSMKSQIDQTKENNWNKIHKKMDYVIEKLGEERIFSEYAKSSYTGFIKGVGKHLDSEGEFIRRQRFSSFEDECLIRNTVGNEDLLVTKIDRSYPFWFIDSGYTNFLEPNKKWHRLVKNHLHTGKYFDAPADRLDNFRSFPKKWRTGGDIIYILEPGPFAANIFHVDLKTWKYDIEAELRKYTDKKIKFREKAPKKLRTNLFKELADDDYYCLISINSNGSTEALWQGVPAITLGQHITNPVARNKIEEIHDLYRGGIGNWLCMLSYSQFTFDELINGTAVNLVKQYHG